MFRRVASGLLVGLLAASAYAVTVGEKPTLDVPTIDGGSIKLAALRGKLVVVDFWSASDAAKHFEQRLGELQKQHVDDGVSFVGICCDATLARGTQFSKDNGLAMPEYYDGKFFTGPVAHAWNQTHVGVVLLGPDGAVLWEGPALAADRAINEALIAHRPTGCDPDVLKAATDALDAADKALASGDNVEALKRAAAVSADAMQNKSFAKRRSDLQPKLDAAADALLAPADAMIAKNQFSDAASELTRLKSQLQGTSVEKQVRDRQAALAANPAAKTQATQLSQNQSAASALAAVRKLRDAGNDPAAYLAAKALLQDYPATPAAADAGTMVAAYEKNAALMKTVADEQADTQTQPILSMARSYAASGMTSAARQRYQAVIDHYPGSHAADIARQEMTALK